MNPYDGMSDEEKLIKTEELVENHKLSPYIERICRNAWHSILNGKFNKELNKTIRYMRISPQAIGALLHDIVSEYVSKYIENGEIKGFRRGDGKEEKDIVCEYDDYFSFEIKTSSQRKVYGNRSFSKSEKGKEKSGYYLTINFEKISKRDDMNSPEILLVRMGWINHDDWEGQEKESGQQAKLKEGVWETQLIDVYRLKININTADAERLQALYGIGTSTAQNIINYRENVGRFEKVDDILNVERVNSKTMNAFDYSIII